LEAQRGWVEDGGDAVAVAIPAAAFTATLIKGDTRGQHQFYRSVAANLVGTFGLKLAIAKDRPDGSGETSFPSGHTSVAFQGASFIHLRYGLRYALPAYAGAAFVGYSREYAQKHDWIDVVSGAALGTLSSLVFTDRFENVQIAAAQGGGAYGLAIHVQIPGGEH